jgi:hypothetical protein
MFFANRLLFTWIYFAISLYVTFDLIVHGLSDSAYESIVQIIVGPLVLIIATMNLISKYKWKKR